MIGRRPQHSPKGKGGITQAYIGENYPEKFIEGNSPRDLEVLGGKRLFLPSISFGRLPPLRTVSFKNCFWFVFYLAWFLYKAYLTQANLFGDLKCFKIKALFFKAWVHRF